MSRRVVGENPSISNYLHLAPARATQPIKDKLVFIVRQHSLLLLTRDCYSNSVRSSVRDTLVLYENGSNISS